MDPEPGLRRRYAQIGAVTAMLAVVIAVVGALLAHSSTAHPTARASVKVKPARVKPTLPAGVNPHDPLLKLGLRTPPGRAPGPSGVAMPLGSPHGWRVVFADDFPAREDVKLGRFSGCAWHGSIRASTCARLPRVTARRWWAYPAGSADTSGHGTYDPGQVLTIGGGVLRFHLHTSRVSGRPLVAAAEPKLPARSRQGAIRFGAYAIRFRADRIPGYEMEFQLYPDRNKDWPRGGSIALPAGYLNGSTVAILHRYGAKRVDQQDIFHQPGAGGWHTVVVQWGATRVLFILDGKVIGDVRNGVPQDPLHLVLQLQTDVIGAAPKAAAEGNVDVAWIKEYATS